MKDYIKKYTQKRFFSQISILWVSFFLALWIYFFVGNSSVGKLVKTNIQEAWNYSNDASGDISIEKDTSYNDQIMVKSNRNMSKVKAFSITFTYNAENLDIKFFSSLFDGASLQNISNEAGIATVFLQFDDPRDIKKWDYLILLKTARKEDKLEFVNMMNANFRDEKWENYLLSTSGIDF